MTTCDRARLVIDLTALSHNLAAVRAAASGAEVAAVVKADAYGLGAGPIARRLWADDVRSFFVARLSEGEHLRRELGERPARIYVLDGLAGVVDARFAAADLTPVLSTLPEVRTAQAAGAQIIALHVDTGMNRQGLTPVQARALAEDPAAPEVTLLVSHLGSGAEPDDPRNAEQLEQFKAICALFPQARTSLAASAGAFLGPAHRHHMVRAGISLYGGGPLERPDPRLRSVATLTAPILDVRELRPGDRVGYGRAFTAERPMRVAIVAAGYADGVIRAAARGGGQAWFAQSPRRLLVVNMDLLVIDLEDAPAHPGDVVELLGPNMPLDDLATAAGTVAHEVLVRLSRRAERVYLES